MLKSDRFGMEIHRGDCIKYLFFKLKSDRFGMEILLVLVLLWGLAR